MHSNSVKVKVLLGYKPNYSNAKSLACDTANEHALTYALERHAAAVSVPKSNKEHNLLLIQNKTTKCMISLMHEVNANSVFDWRNTL